MGLWPLISSFLVYCSICYHLQLDMNEKNLGLFFKDEFICPLQVIKISNIFGKFWNYSEFLKQKNEENSYQIHNIFKKSEIFTIDVYYNA